MANQEQLEFLSQGVEVWNKWREKNPMTEIDLSHADLPRTTLTKFNLRDANLREASLGSASLHGANLRDANLIEANLIGANLIGANLRRADLRGADLRGADFRRAVLSGADLSEANLYETNLASAKLYKTKLYKTKLNEAKLARANLISSNLHGANLISANLRGANLSGASFGDANLSEAFFGNTTISRMDLSRTHGLESVKHTSPSPISTYTIRLSKGEIPEVFLRGCGLSDWEIESAKLYKPDLSNKEIDEILYKIHDLRAQQSIQISPLFISYSHADTAFVEKLEPQLTKLGIRFWRDIHNATAGRLETQVDRAMRQNPTVILILSENSTNSDWVEHEARLARDLEKEIGRDVLCPIALDASWKSAKWPKRLMEQIMEYNILDFSKWKDDRFFEQVFNKMISGLDMFYKK